MPGLMVLIRAPRLPHRTAVGHDTQRGAAFRDLIGVKLRSLYANNADFMDERIEPVNYSRAHRHA
jgi:hypothetical protein